MIPLLLLAIAFYQFFGGKHTITPIIIAVIAAILAV